MALTENLDIDAYIEEFVDLNGEMLLSVLDSCIIGSKVRDVSQVPDDFNREIVMC